MKKENCKDIKFEDALDMLEGIINSLQDGNLSLDESLKKFEEGICLVRVCQERLEDAETKVTLLLKDEKGNTSEVPFCVEGEEQ